MILSSRDIILSSQWQNSQWEETSIRVNTLKTLKEINYFTTPEFCIKLHGGSSISQSIVSLTPLHSFLPLHPLEGIFQSFTALRGLWVHDLVGNNQPVREFPDCERCPHHLAPAATLVPSGLKVTWLTCMGKRVRIPSGAPSGNVWIWTVLLETAVISFPFWQQNQS